MYAHTQVLWRKERPNVVLPVNGFHRKRCPWPNKPYWSAEEVEEAFFSNAKIQAVKTQEVSVAELGGGCTKCGSMYGVVQ